MSILTNVTGSLHALDDRLIGARMLGWMTEEAHGANWWLCGITSDGRMIEWDSSALGSYAPSKAKKYYATRILSALADLELDGGTWLVGWIDDCKRLQLVFKDRDGDIHIPIDCDKNWLTIREWDMGVWQNMAVHAYCQWQEFVDNMDISSNQQYRLAAGEKAPSAH